MKGKKVVDGVVAGIVWIASSVWIPFVVRNEVPTEKILQILGSGVVFGVVIATVSYFRDRKTSAEQSSGRQR